MMSNLHIKFLLVGLLKIQFYSFHRRQRRKNTREAKFILSCNIHRIYPFLIQENEEDDIISKTSNTMKSRHLNHKGKDIINEGIQCLVDHCIGRNSRHRVQLVVDEQLRSHWNKTYVDDHSLSKKTYQTNRQSWSRKLRSKSTNSYEFHRSMNK